MAKKKKKTNDEAQQPSVTTVSVAPLDEKDETITVESAVEGAAPEVAQAPADTFQDGETFDPDTAADGAESGSAETQEDVQTEDPVEDTTEDAAAAEPKAAVRLNAPVVEEPQIVNTQQKEYPTSKELSAGAKKLSTLTPAERPVSAQADMDTLRKHFQSYCSTYVTYRKGRATNVKYSSGLAMRYFVQIMDFVRRHPHVEIFDDTLAFFREHQKTYLNPSSVFAGFNEIPEDTQLMIRMFYDILYRALDNKLTMKQINMDSLEYSKIGRPFITGLSKFLARRE